ncbi:MAG: T9SS type A sorting domain-containing protein [Bacteroidota bacterium]
MPRPLSFIFTAAAALALLLFPAPTVSAQSDGTIALRGGAPTAPSMARQQALSAGPSWQAFRAEHGAWSALWNESTGTPHRAFGPSAGIPGVGRLSADNVAAAGEVFIRTHPELFGAPVEELRRVGAVEADRRFYVSYLQTYEGLDVLLSEVELRIFENGRVMAFGATTYPDIEVNTTPALSPEAARLAATEGLAFNASTDEAVTGDLAILPLASASEDRRYDYTLVYRVDVETTAPLGRYLTYVDAQTGEVHWRHNLVVNHHYHEHDAHHGSLERAEPSGAPLAMVPASFPFVPEAAAPYAAAAEFTGAAVGTVQPYDPFDPFEEQPFEKLDVTIDGVGTVTTDATGAFTFDATAPTTISAELSGPFINANNQQGADASLSFAFDPAQDDVPTVSWTDDNSTAAERMVVYHTNIIHTFNKVLDPNFVGLDYEMPAAVNINDQCNASWNGVGMNFFRAGGPCPNTGQMPSVIYHEYGHGINQTQYDQADDGLVNGSTRMFNRALNEGMADVQSNLLEDNPVIGSGFFGAGSVLRDMRQNFRYPDTYTGGLPPDDLGGAYDDSQILSGAFWDVRVAIGGQEGIDVLRRIAHFSRYGRPDDPNTTFIGLAEFFLEALIADDDDGDLANGTPNFDAITEGFTGRGIGLNLYVPGSFEHEALEDTQELQEPYLVEFGVDPIVGGADKVRMLYTTDNFATVQEVVPTEVAPNSFEALIPAQPRGTLVRYYFSVDFFTATEPLILPGDDISSTFAFVVGTEEVFFDDAEEDRGWTLGLPDDTATRGIWARGDPERTEENGLDVQPARDHTPGIGRDAYVTDPIAGSAATSGDVDGGRTTLLTPIYDMRGYGDPIVRYWKYYTNDRGPSPGRDVWRVDISNDGGQTWAEVERTTRSTNAWEAVVLRVADYVTPSAQVQLRFLAQDSPAGSLVEALIDDFQILSNPDAVSNEEDTAGAPLTFALRGNFPNPFSAATTLAFDLPERADVTLVVYDVMGRAVRTLADEPYAAGSHTVEFNASDLAGGTYFARITAGDQVATHKMVLLK